MEAPQRAEARLLPSADVLDTFPRFSEELGEAEKSSEQQSTEGSRLRVAPRSRSRRGHGKGPTAQLTNLVGRAKRPSKGPGQGRCALPQDDGEVHVLKEPSRSQPAQCKSDSAHLPAPPMLQRCQALCLRAAILRLIWSKTSGSSLSSIPPQHPQPA